MIRISQILRSAHDVLDFLSSEDTIQKSMDKITEQLPWVPEVLVAKPRRRVARREADKHYSLGGSSSLASEKTSGIQGTEQHIQSEETSLSITLLRILKLTVHKINTSQRDQR